MSDALELAALRERLIIAREAHREAVAELERLQRKPRVSPMALHLAGRRVDSAREELIAARRLLIRSV